MKATDNQQADLLALGDLDLEIKRSKTALSQLTNGHQFSQLRNQQSGLAVQLIEARNALDTVDLELQRAETDLNLVEQRIAKDNELLNKTASAKDAQGIQAELATLARRKSDLEDAELVIIDQKEAAEAKYAQILADKTAVDAEIAALESNVDAEVLKLRSGLDLLSQRRARQASTTDSNLLAAYEKKLDRGIAVGKLNGRECGACRIGIGATALAEINALPRDVFATCPECQAFLVR
ncbi:MAG: hypothetical protein RIS82_169 [Actinomycetota bacterium]|jgi:predicted  nucleic acid-binding Zn-ribbon protein